jgi:hypothetical protein
MQYCIGLILWWWSLWTKQCRNIQCGIILYDLRNNHFVGLVSWIIYLQIFPFTFGKLQVKPVIKKENTIMRDLHDTAYSTKIFKPSWLCKTHIKLLCNTSSYCSHYSLRHTNCMTVSGLPQIKEHFVCSIVICGVLTPPMTMEQCCEMSPYKIQTPGNQPKERIQHSEHGKSWNQEKMNYLIWILGLPHITVGTSFWSQRVNL